MVCLERKPSVIIRKIRPNGSHLNLPGPGNNSFKVTFLPKGTFQVAPNLKKMVE